MGKTVVVTGGSGYIGGAVIEQLVARGDTVIALARTPEAGAKVEALGATALQGELTDAETLTTAATGADAAIHLGATGGADAAAADLAAAKALLAGLSGKTYVHTGGVWVYGNTDGVVDETAPFAPPQLTAWRIDNEAEVLATAQNGGHPVIVLPGVVVGRGGGIPLGVLTTGDAARYIDDGAAHWALVHLDDIAGLYLRALDDGKAGERYLGVAGTLTGKEIAEAIAKADGTPDVTASVSLEDLRGELGIFADALVLDQQLSSEKARRDLGWSPAHTDLAVDLAAGR